MRRRIPGFVACVETKSKAIRAVSIGIIVLFAMFENYGVSDLSCEAKIRICNSKPHSGVMHG